ncbi:uncharacterized protein LOC123550295 [Mercenaria mercenaria]|uniref:uncharacterized protein LOC123550295 n=1 Tax=Mercenaria mercenaria TaxID=6596 RepID=UPI00234EECBE|nr:uncharacterized protein LOC123550295 [Mercenaria mercenaria]
MTGIHTQRMSILLKTNLLWIIIVNVALVVLYLSVSHKIHSSDINNSAYSNDVHIDQFKYNSTELLVNSKNKTEVQLEKVISGDCKGLLFPVHLSLEVRWRPVNKNQTAFVFSVYSMKDKRKLVIIGAKIKDHSTYYCQLWYRKDKYRSFNMEQRTARVIVLPEGHGKLYTAALFECLLTSSAIPDFVSVVNESCETPLHVLGVDQHFNKGTDRRLFTVCLTPLNYHYDGDSELVEWIELNKILGAEKFIVYNYSSSINVKRVLDLYSKRGTTEVVQWQLPMKVDSYQETKNPVEIHYFGQIAALNDCMYRSKSHSEFIVNIDLDEFIIPHSDHAQTWSDMLEQLYKIKRKVYSAYLFRNTFFRKEWKNTNISVLNKTLIEKYRLITLQKFEHEQNIYPVRVRSKYFARTSEIFSLMVHDVRGLSYTKMLAVSPKIGLLHHYRNCEDLYPATADRVVDNTVIHKYGKTLVHNIQNVWLELQKNFK